MTKSSVLTVGTFVIYQNRLQRYKKKLIYASVFENKFFLSFGHYKQPVFGSKICMVRYFFVFLQPI